MLFILPERNRGAPQPCLVAMDPDASVVGLAPCKPRGSRRNDAAVAFPGAGLNGKGRTATTGAGCRWILDDKLRALGIFLVVDLGTYQILKTHRIDK